MSLRLHCALYLLAAMAMPSVMMAHDSPQRQLRVGGKVTLCTLTSEWANTTSISNSSSSSRTTFVQKTYQTRRMRPLDAWRNLLKNAQRGACDNRDVCQSVCGSLVILAITKDTCTCQTASASSSPSTTNTTQDAPRDNNTPVTCGPNAKVVTTGTVSECQCWPGFDGNATVGCIDRDECRSPSLLTGTNQSSTWTPPCASNQLCVNTVGSYTCSARTCQNPYGNPCGPTTACTDAPTGFVCTPLYNATYICPGGSCPSTETCVAAGGNRTVASCQCRAGHHRPVPYLACVPL